MPVNMEGQPTGQTNFAQSMVNPFRPPTAGSTASLGFHKLEDFAKPLPVGQPVAPVAQPIAPGNQLMSRVKAFSASLQPEQPQAQQRLPQQPGEVPASRTSEFSKGTTASEAGSGLGEVAEAAELAV